MTALPEQLAQIGLRHTGRHLDDLVALATRKRWGPAELLEHLAETERAGHAPAGASSGGSERSRIGRLKPMSDFDWSWPKRIDREAVEAALRLEFPGEARNVVLSRSPGPLKDHDRPEHRSPGRARRPPGALHHRVADALPTSRPGSRRAASTGDCATTATAWVSWSWTRSATCPATHATPTCCFRSSAGATRRRAWWSRRIYPSASGLASFPTRLSRDRPHRPPGPPRRHPRYRGRELPAPRRPSEPRLPPRQARRLTSVPVQIPALSQVRQHLAGSLVGATLRS